MTIFLASELEQHAVDAQVQVSVNCHFPNGRGTDKWANIFYKEDLGLFYFLKPPVEGWKDSVDSFTQAQMMENVVLGPNGVTQYDW